MDGHSTSGYCVSINIICWKSKKLDAFVRSSVGAVQCYRKSGMVAECSGGFTADRHHLLVANRIINT